MFELCKLLILFMVYFLDIKMILIFCIDVKDIRGVGLQVSKLESADTSKQGISCIEMNIVYTSRILINFLYFSQQSYFN